MAGSGRDRGGAEKVGARPLSPGGLPRNEMIEFSARLKNKPNLNTNDKQNFVCI